MRNWITSMSGAIALSTIALLTFLGRGFMDWRYEWTLHDLGGALDLPGALAYMAVSGIWVWALLASGRGSRRGVFALLILALILDVAFALATYFIFCPPWTGCEGWPNAWLWNWTNLITGLLAVGATALHLRQAQSAG